MPIWFLELLEGDALGPGGGFLFQGHGSKYKGRQDLLESLWIGNPKTWALALKPPLHGHVIWGQVA